MTARVDTLRVAAGQLYECQVPKAPIPQKGWQQAIRSHFESKKEQLNPAALPTFEQYTNEAVESFNAILDNIEDEQLADRLAKFWDKTVEDATDAEKQVAAKTVLSQLLFLADSECEELNAILESETPQNGIATQFQKELAEAVKEARESVTKVQNVLIGQQKETVEANLLSNCAAYALITSDGFFNSALIPDVQKALGNKQPFMTKMLEAFAQNPALLDAIEDGSEDDKSSILRGMDANAKVAVLSACLMPNNAKSLPATAGTLLREVDLGRFIAQLKDILEEGTWSRRVEGLQKKVVVGSDVLTHPLLTHTFQAATTGEITKNLYYNNNFLWEVRGMAKACHALGLSKVMQDELKKALTTLGGEKPAARFAVTPLAVIKLLAGDNEDRLRDASYAFLSAYTNPLFDTWHEMTENLVQVRSENRHFARVHSAVGRVLAPLFAENDKVFTAFKAKLEIALAATKAKNAEELRAQVQSALPEGSDKIVEFIAKKQFIQALGAWEQAPAATLEDALHLFEDAKKKAFTVATPKELSQALEAAVKEEKEGMRLILSSPNAAIEYTAFSTPSWSNAAKAAYNTLKDEEERAKLISWIRESVLVEEAREAFDEYVGTMSAKWDHVKYRDELINRVSHLVDAAAFSSVKKAIKAEILNTLKDHLAPFGKTVSGETVGLFWDPFAKAQAVGMIRNDNLVRLPDSWVAGKWEFCHAPVA